ncbi:putative 40s ribosomal protein s20 [Alternaria alternata]|nr:putative 40s ribosomal protein s20 [Alternaria alternata]
MSNVYRMPSVSSHGQEHISPKERADGALDAELLVLGTVDELLADLLEALDVAGGEGDADLEPQSVNGPARIALGETCLVDLGTLTEVLLGLVVRHLVGLECCVVVRY